MNENVIRILAIILVIICVIWLILPFFETFDRTGSDFVPTGCPRYGLRGDRLRTSNIDKYYMNPNLNVRLSQSNGVMWQSNYSPDQQGVPGCYKVDCPQINEFDLDTCWKCN